MISTWAWSVCGAEAEGLAGAEQGLLGLPEGAGVGAPPRCAGAELWAQHIWEFGIGIPVPHSPLLWNRLAFHHSSDFSIKICL